MTLDIPVKPWRDTTIINNNNKSDDIFSQREKKDEFFMLDKDVFVYDDSNNHDISPQYHHDSDDNDNIMNHNDDDSLSSFTKAQLLEKRKKTTRETRRTTATTYTNTTTVMTAGSTIASVSRKSSNNKTNDIVGESNNDNSDDHLDDNNKTEEEGITETDDVVDNRKVEGDNTNSDHQMVDSNYSNNDDNYDDEEEQCEYNNDISFFQSEDGSTDQDGVYSPSSSATNTHQYDTIELPDDAYFDQQHTSTESQKNESENSNRSSCQSNSHDKNRLGSCLKSNSRYVSSSTTKEDFHHHDNIECVNLESLNQAASSINESAYDGDDQSHDISNDNNQIIIDETKKRKKREKKGKNKNHNASPVIVGSNSNRKNKTKLTANEKYQQEYLKQLSEKQMIQKKMELEKQLHMESLLEKKRNKFAFLSRSRKKREEEVHDNEEEEKQQPDVAHHEPDSPQQEHDSEAEKAKRRKLRLFCKAQYKKQLSLLQSKKKQKEEYDRIQAIKAQHEKELQSKYNITLLQRRLQRKAEESEKDHAAGDPENNNTTTSKQSLLPSIKSGDKSNKQEYTSTKAISDKSGSTQSPSLPSLNWYERKKNIRSKASNLADALDKEKEKEVTEKTWVKKLTKKQQSILTNISQIRKLEEEEKAKHLKRLQNRKNILKAKYQHVKSSYLNATLSSPGAKEKFKSPNASINKVDKTTIKTNQNQKVDNKKKIFKLPSLSQKKDGLNEQSTMSGKIHLADPVNENYESWKKRNRIPIDQKIFEISGWYPSIRDALLQRGWICLSKFHYNKTKPTLTDSSQQQQKQKIVQPVQQPGHRKKERDFFVDLKYTLRSSEINYNALKPYQKVNHFQRSFVLTTKAGLLKTLQNDDSYFSHNNHNNSNDTNNTGNTSNTVQTDQKQSFTKGMSEGFDGGFLRFLCDSDIKSFFPKSYDMTNLFHILEFIEDFYFLKAESILLDLSQLIQKEQHAQEDQDNGGYVDNDESEDDTDMNRKSDKNIRNISINSEVLNVLFSVMKKKILCRSSLSLSTPSSSLPSFFCTGNDEDEITYQKHSYPLISDLECEILENAHKWLYQQVPLSSTPPCDSTKPPPTHFSDSDLDTDVEDDSSVSSDSSSSEDSSNLSSTPPISYFDPNTLSQHSSIYSYILQQRELEFSNRKQNRDNTNLELEDKKKTKRLLDKRKKIGVRLNSNFRQITMNEIEKIKWFTNDSSNHLKGSEEQKERTARSIDYFYTNDNDHHHSKGNINSIDKSRLYKRSNNLWICKPAAKCRGQGIRIFGNDLEQILKYVGVLPTTFRSGIISNVNHHPNVKNTENKNFTSSQQWVIQKYIENPLTVANRKIDVRQWVLVTSWNPLIIWFYNDCYIRFAVDTYNPSSMSSFSSPAWYKNLYRHLSNNSISKHNENFNKSFYAENGEEVKDYMWTSAQFEKWIMHHSSSILGGSNREKEMKNFYRDEIVPQMKDIARKTIMCAQGKVIGRKNSWELYGLDFMITPPSSSSDSLSNVDENMYQVYLIEINASPACDYSTSVTKNFVSKALPDIIKVVVDCENSNHRRTMDARHESEREDCNHQNLDEKNDDFTVNDDDNDDDEQSEKEDNDDNTTTSKKKGGESNTYVESTKTTGKGRTRQKIMKSWDTGGWIKIYHGQKFPSSCYTAIKNNSGNNNMKQSSSAFKNIESSAPTNSNDISMITGKKILKDKKNKILLLRKKHKNRQGEAKLSSLKAVDKEKENVIENNASDSRIDNHTLHSDHQHITTSTQKFKDSSFLKHGTSAFDKNKSPVQHSTLRPTIQNIVFDFDCGDSFQ